MKPVILIHRGEVTNVFADHLDVCKRAFPEADVVIWDRRPPKLKGKVVVKVGNSYYLGTEQFNALGEELSAASLVFVAINDYTSPVPTQVRDALRGHKVVVLTTVPGLVERTRGRRMWDWFLSAEYVDWNRASWKHVTARVPKHDGLLYWGALRPNRVPSFDRYFTKALYPVHLSGALRSQSKWLELYPNANWLGRLALDQIADYRGTVYMEDECQHDEYHSVASRFYEALGRGLLTLVDSRCLGTFEAAGINVKPWVVSDQTHVVAALKRHSDLRAHQQHSLVRDYAADTVKQLRAVMKKYVREGGRREAR